MKPKHASCWAIAVVISIVSMQAGCKPTKPPPAEPLVPQAKVSASHYAGHPLGAPTTRPVATLSPLDAVSVRVTWVALKDVPPGATEPVGGAAKLIAASRGGRPVLPSGRLTRMARLSRGDAAAAMQQQAAAGSLGGQSAVVIAQQAALPAGVTATFEVTDPASVNDPVGGHRLVQLLAYRPAADAATTAPATRPTTGGVAVQLALVVQDMVPGDALGDEGDLPHQVEEPTPEPAGKPGAKKAATDAPKAGAGAQKPGAPATQPAGRGKADKPPAAPLPPVLQREFALLAAEPVAGATRTAFIVPFAFGGSSAKAVAVFVELAPGSDDPDHERALTQTAEDLRRSAAGAAARPDAFAVLSADWPALESAMSALAFPMRRRAALVFISSQAGARLCEDAALVADDESLAKLSERVLQALAPPAAATNPAAPPPPARTRESVGWAMDRAALALMSEHLGMGDLPPELASILAMHAGEAGRQAGSLEEILKAATGQTDLDHRLTAENLILLEDNSPASRVRAYDWLRARNRAPADFDPLGAPKDRRAALERALAGATATTPAATSPGGKP